MYSRSFILYRDYSSLLTLSVLANTPEVEAVQ